MTREMPLPMPFSVINSPSHMTIIVPAVKLKAVRTLLARPLASTPWVASPADVAKPWIKAKMTVPYLVYSLSFLRPSSPSLASFSQAGMITCSKLTMMLAVIYGPMDKVKMEILAKAPPEMASRRPKMPPCPSRNWAIAARLAPGTGIKLPKRMMRKIPRV